MQICNNNWVDFPIELEQRQTGMKPGLKPPTFWSLVTFTQTFYPYLEETQSEAVANPHPTHTFPQDIFVFSLIIKN